VSALRTANDVPEPRHIDVLGAILGNPPCSGRRARFRSRARCWRLRSPIAVLVLVASLAVLPVAHWVAAVVADCIPACGNSARRRECELHL